MNKRHSLFCVRGVCVCVQGKGDDGGLVKIKMNVWARVGGCNENILADLH